MRHAITCLIVFVCSQAPAQNGSSNWPQFRGPGGTGSVGASTAPVTFDQKSDVLWRVAVPAGHSSPCIWGDRIFLTGHDDDTLIVLAFDRTTGKQIWRHELDASRIRPYGHPHSNRAMPTPCTNGKRVFCYFGSYGLIAFDLAGKIAWEKKMKAPRTMFGVGTSPILVDDVIVLVRDGARESAILAYDEATGEERWKAPRLSYRTTHCTPFLWRNEQRTEIIVGGTGRLDSLDPKTGEQLWQVDGLTPLVCTTPTANRDRLYFAAWSTPSAHGLSLLQSLFGDVAFTANEVKDAKAAFARLDKDDDGKIQRAELAPCRAREAFGMADRNRDGSMDLKEFKPFHSMPRGAGENVAMAVAPGGKGNVTKTHVRWKTKRGIPYVAAPLLHRGRLYLIKSRGILSCLDAETGEPHYGPLRLKDRSEYYAAPVGVGDRVLLCSTRGTIYVLRASDEFEIERTVELGERIFSVPAVAGDRIYVRTEKSLFAFGKKRP